MNIAHEVITLRRMTVGQLQDRYVEVFGEAVRSRHKQYLVRRIAWRLQANAEGGLASRRRASMRMAGCCGCEGAEVAWTALKLEVNGMRLQSHKENQESQSFSCR